VPRYGEELGACSGVLGFAHASLGNLPEADRFLKIARDVFSELVQLNPAVGQYQHRLAITNSQVAQLLAMDQQHVKAIETVDGALKTMTALVTQFPGVTGYGDTLASITARKSLILADAGEKTTAAVARKTAIEQWQKTISKEAAPAYQYHLLKYLLQNTPRLNTEEKTVALSLAKKCVETTPLNGDYRVLLAAAHGLSDQAAEAQKALQQATTLRTETHVRDLLVEAWLLALSGDSSKAEPILEKAREWLAENQPGNTEMARFLVKVEGYVSSKK
jgi:tetratricopeptide (TPR) repeat protein